MAIPASTLHPIEPLTPSRPFVFDRPVLLRDGTAARVRLLKPTDTDALHAMFCRLSPKSLRYVHDDVTDLEVIRGWTRRIEPEKVLPLVVQVGNDIVADGTLHRKKAGPTRHVGRIRVVVEDRWLGKGIGTILTEELIRIAREAGLLMVAAQFAEYEEGDAVEAMKALSFQRVAIVRDWYVDPDGKTHSMTILTRRLDT